MQVTRSSIIYKFILPLQQTHALGLPEGSEILKVGTQGDNICIWVLIPDLANPVKQRRFAVVPTGIHFADMHLADKGRECAYIGTVEQGMFVWHIFEVL